MIYYFHGKYLDDGDGTRPGFSLCLEEKEDELKHQSKKLLKSDESINKWKKAWFDARENIGWLWWHHPAIEDKTDETYKKYRRMKEGEIKV
jgi:hypothetical protein